MAMGRSREGTRFRLMGEHLRRHPFRYAVGFALLLAAVSAQLFIPQLLQAFADTYAAGTLTTEGAMVYGGGVLLVALIMAAARIGARIVLFHSGRAYDRNIRSRLFAQWLRLPTEYYQRRRIGDLMAHATNDINLAREKLNHGLIMFVETVFLVGLSLYLMATTVHPWLTVAAFVPLPFLTVTAYVFRRRTQRQSHQVQEAFGDLNVQVQQFAAGIHVIKGFVQEAAERERFAAVNRANMEANRQLFQTNALFLAASSFIIGMSFLIALTYGGWLAMQGWITLGQFIAFYTYLGQLIFPIESLGRVINLFQRAKAAEERIGGILSLEPSIRDRDDCVSLPAMKGHVAVRNLTFTYPGARRPALRDVSLDIPAGSMLGIIGKVGSGKTTLVQLLLRLFDPPPGTIWIDGVPIERIALEDLRRNIGYVPQDSFLFSSPIRDNIDFHPVAHPEGEIQQAAARAHIHGNIMQFPRKYDTELGERGIRLSGGQRQRVAIARALLKDAPMIILDDSFSAVDADTESRILADLRQYAQGRTTIIVSHRVASVQHADQIIVLDDGRIVEQGTHEQLMQAGKLYARLAVQQMQADDRTGVESR